MRSSKMEGLGDEADGTLARRGGERLPLWACLAAAAAIPALCLIVYYPALSAPFYFDDFLYIAGNPKIRSIGNFWPPHGSRYLVFLSFAVNHYFGELSPWGYHLANVLTHILNSLLVFTLVSLTFRTPAALRNGPWENRTVFSLSLAVSAIFAVHPVQTQAVSYVTQRFVLVASFFYLSSVAAYVKWRLSPDGAPSSYAFYAVSLLSAILAQFSKEISFTLPAVILLYEFTFFEGLGVIRRKLPWFIPYLLVLAIIPFSVLTPGTGEEAGKDAVEHMLKGGQMLDIETLNPYGYLVTQFRVIVTYIRLLVFPAGQNFHYDYPRFTSILDPGPLLSLSFLLLVLALNAWLYLRSRRAPDFLLLASSFGVFWFFIALSVESSVIPIKDVIFEHRVYLPSVGFITASVSLLFRATCRAGRGKAAFTALILLSVISLSIASYRRNLLWADRTAMYEDMAKKSYKLPRAHLVLANEYKDKGRLTEAEREYKISIELDPKYATAHNDLGALYFMSGRSEESLAAFRKAFEFDPDTPGIHYNMGIASDRLGLIDEAIAHYETSLATQPRFVNVHFHLGVDYLKKGMTSSAEEELERFIALAPPSTERQVAEAREVLRRIRAGR